MNESNICILFLIFYLITAQELRLLVQIQY